MQFLRYLLLPFSFLYGLGVRFRNWLFDANIKKPVSFEVPVIGIGNLSAGGTGKTPMAEYVLQLLLQKGYKPAMLSRGYKRQSKGYQLVKPYSSAVHVGDEPYQVKKKIPDAVVAVCEDRALGIKRIREEHPDVNVIVLDDSYQHRNVKPGFNILLTDYSKPFYKDQLLPAGMLREPESGKSRADVIIVTKGPVEVPEGEKNLIRSKIKPTAHQTVYFTSISYQSLIKDESEGVLESVFPVESLKGYKVVLFTGIAKTRPLEIYLKSQGIQSTLIAFPDHHTFTAGDIKKITNSWNSIPEMNKLIITTEKDWRRLEGTAEAGMLAGFPVYFLPISVKWDEAEKLGFDHKIIQYVQTNKRNG